MTKLTDLMMEQSYNFKRIYEGISVRIRVILMEEKKGDDGDDK